MFGIGIQELLVILLILLILFGGKKLPELMKGMGSAIREFKKAISVDDDQNTKKSTKSDKS